MEVNLSGPNESRVIEFLIDGNLIAKVSGAKFTKYRSFNIFNFKVLSDYRRQGYGTQVVLELFDLLDVETLDGVTLTYYAARFWGQFDKGIPLELTDEELEEWCYNYGHFEINKNILEEF